MIWVSDSHVGPHPFEMLQDISSDCGAVGCATKEILNRALLEWRLPTPVSSSLGLEFCKKTLKFLWKDHLFWDFFNICFSSHHKCCPSLGYFGISTSSVSLQPAVKEQRNLMKSGLSLGVKMTKAHLLSILYELLASPSQSRCSSEDYYIFKEIV